MTTGEVVRHRLNLAGTVERITRWRIAFTR